jgi:predicted nuclease with TOPRIM domain
MSDAARAEVEGRAAEALRMYEWLVTSETGTPSPSPNRLQALMAAARLRLSADPNLRDLPKARAYLLDASSINPKLSATVPVADMLALLDRETEGQAQQEQTDQRASALRGENRSLRNTVKGLQEELAKAQDELARKDEALHRATEKLLEKAPRPQAQQPQH